MTKTSESLGKQIMQLPAVDRTALVDQILESLDASDPSSDDLWAAEAEDRLGAWRRGEIDSALLAEVLTKYQTRPRT